MSAQPNIQTLPLKEIEFYENRLYKDSREIVALRVVKGFESINAQLKDFEDDVRELRQYFDNAYIRSSGNPILGCYTWTEFCEKRLHRNIRSVQYMLAGGNPVAKRKKKGHETVSPREDPTTSTGNGYEERRANLPNIDIEAPRRDNPHKHDCELIAAQAKKEVGDAWRELQKTEQPKTNLLAAHYVEKQPQPQNQDLKSRDFTVPTILAGEAALAALLAEVNEIIAETRKIEKRFAPLRVVLGKKETVSITKTTAEHHLLCGIREALFNIYCDSRDLFNLDSQSGVYIRARQAKEKLRKQKAGS